jgi:uncharacterized membrane protein
MKTSEISLAIILTSLYAVLVIVLAPISFGPIQLRVADCLIPLAALFGLPAIIGVSAGCFIGNAYMWLGPQDVILGTVANLVGATIIYALRKRQLLACVAGSLPIGVIVGGYLWFFFGFEAEFFGLQIPVWGAMIGSITISTLVAVAGIGYLVLLALSRSGITDTLKSRGLKVYTEK